MPNLYDDLLSKVSALSIISRHVLTSIRLSKSTMGNIKQNLFWAFADNAVLIPVGAGVLYPAYGIFLDQIVTAGAMSVDTTTVMLNALRLNRFRPTQK